ncbi:PQQ-binding-like beta-propeller repeat protein [Tepiditoga spiralis]|uniref:PQQ-binding-like beta-propeller repeat protein n=1 Tax=Tepiditoga spiralis TaxID=2108365 RepID=UPI00168A1C06
MGSSPAIGQDGTIYVGSVDNNLYAITSKCKGVSESSWPMFRQNIEHTGRK